MATRARLTFLVFCLASFGSALLMFWLEPLLGKIVLPYLGGTPAVWNTCMLFYQAMLCLGYLFSHWLAQRPGAVQAVVYPLVGVLALLTLPIDLAAPVAAPESPALWLLGQLTIEAGLPFLVLGCASPLLQSWYARLPGSGEPYGLYAASNLGSFIGLLAFPFVIEPLLPTATQLGWWRSAFALLVIALVFFGLRLRGNTTAAEVPVPAATRSAPPTLRTLLTWTALAFAPSSLLYGTTQYLTTDLAPIPLLWVVPLALYLLTFIIAFGARGSSVRTQRLIVRACMIAAVGWAAAYKTGATEPLLLLIGVHLITFFLLSLACHQRLVRERPAVGDLTLFYLCISAGGVLAGVLHALIAPALLPDLWEYPAAIMIALGLTGSAAHISKTAYLRLAACGILAFVSGIGARELLESHALMTIVGIGIPLIACFLLARTARSLALGLALVLLAPSAYQKTLGERIARERGFFGVVQVHRDRSGTYHEMLHGNTVHGAQAMYVANTQEPLTYYGRSGPAGDVFAALGAGSRSIRAAVVGLGTGTLAAYARPNDNFTFFEINPAVERIARDTSLFTYMAHARGTVDVILGDARLTLATASDSSFDLLVLDAFSSDAIPVHLLTREAFDLYLRKLRPGGWIALHLSNRYLTLAPVIGDIARMNGLHGLVGYGNPDAQQRAWRLEPSTWVVIARGPLEMLSGQDPERWLGLSGTGHRPWTDDYSSLWRVMTR